MPPTKYLLCLMALGSNDLHGDVLTRHPSSHGRNETVAFGACNSESKQSSRGMVEKTGWRLNETNPAVSGIGGSFLPHLFLSEHRPGRAQRPALSERPLLLRRQKLLKMTYSC